MCEFKEDFLLAEPPFHEAISDRRYPFRTFSIETDPFNKRPTFFLFVLYKKKMILVHVYGTSQV